MLLTGANIAITELAKTTSGQIRLLKQLLSLPFLGYVPIYPEEVVDELNSDISTQLVVSTINGGKEFVTDNAAPKPRIWKVKGYLKGLPYVELSNWFMPSLGAQKLVIDTAVKSRKPIIFRTDEGEILDVLVKSRTYTKTADNMNTIKIDAIVQEFLQFNIDAVITNSGIPAQRIIYSMPSLGSPAGLVFQLGFIAMSDSYYFLDQIKRIYPYNIFTLDTAAKAATAPKRFPSAIEVFSMPNGSSSVLNFSFYCSTSIGAISCNFKFFDPSWYLDFELVEPKAGYTDELRTTSVTPNIIIGPEHAEYSLRISLNALELDPTNIWSAKLEVLIW